MSTGISPAGLLASEKLTAAVMIINWSGSDKRHVLTGGSVFLFHHPAGKIVQAGLTQTTINVKGQR